MSLLDEWCVELGEWEEKGSGILIGGVIGAR